MSHLKNRQVVKKSKVVKIAMIAMIVMIVMKVEVTWVLSLEELPVVS